jgi:hypothetical protein
LKASKIDISDAAARLMKRAVATPVPVIDGNNFFSGEYDSGSGSIGFTIDSPEEWEQFWRNTLKEEPPGPLPKRCKAIMIAEHHPGDPVELIPERIAREGKEIKVIWQRIHTAMPDSKPGPSRYAVLLIPNRSQSQYFNDVYLAEEQRRAAEDMARDIRVLTEGTPQEVKILQPAKFRRRAEFLPF